MRYSDCCKLLGFNTDVNAFSKWHSSDNLSNISGDQTFKLSKRENKKDEPKPVMFKMTLGNKEEKKE